MTQTIVYKDGETAGDIILRILKERKNEKLNITYVVREFSMEDSLDVNGSNVGCFTYGVSGASFNNIEAEQKVKKGDSARFRNVTYNNIAQALEASIGAPFLDRPKVDFKKIKLRPIGEVAGLLNKYERKKTKELKTLKEFFEKIKESLNPRTNAGLVACKYLYNGGKARNPEEVFEWYFSLIVKRERDKLFYIRRHANNQDMHICHDEGILESIKIAKWMIVKGNPFTEVLNLTNQREALRHARF